MSCIIHTKQDDASGFANYFRVADEWSSNGEVCCMKGRNPSKADKLLWDQLCQLGCIACRKDGRLNTWVSIHHIDGRTKPGAHQKVLPLCAGHHQKGTGAVGLVAVHPDKAEFERMYGQQEQLLGECLQLLKGESHAA